MKLINETFSIFNRNLFVISEIVVTVLFPVNLFLNFLESFMTMHATLFVWMSVAIGLTFYPIIAGAITYLAYKQKLNENETITYKEAIGVGFSKWFPLISASIVADLIIVLNMLLLVIPGLYFIVRYAFINPIVVIEEAKDSPRKQSYELTKGIGWQIFFIQISYVIILLITQVFISFIQNGILGKIPFHKVIFLKSLLDCVVSIVGSLLTISIFLLYWHKKNNTIEPYQEESIRL